MMTTTMMTTTTTTSIATAVTEVFGRRAIWLALVFACAAQAQPVEEADAGVPIVEEALDAGVEVDAGVTQLAQPVAPTRVAEEPAPSTPAKRSAHHAFRVWAGGGLFTRDLKLTGDELGRQRQRAAGSTNVGISLFPGAAITSNALAHLGAFFTADFGVGMHSRNSATQDVFAEFGSRLRVGAQGRIPANDDLAIVINAGWSRHEMGSADKSIDGSSQRVTPNVLLNGLRAGAAVQWHVWGPVSAEFNAAGEYLVFFGELATRYFPNTTGVAFDTGANVSVELLPNISARLAFEWQRYLLNLHPQTGSAFSSTSAYDNYVWLNLGLMISM